MQLGEGANTASGEGGEPRRAASGRQFNVWAPKDEFAVAWAPGNGWNLRLDAFSSTMDLFRKLNSWRFDESWWPGAAEIGLHGRVRKLGIMAHGDPGQVRVSPTISSDVFTRRPQERDRWGLIGTEFVIPRGTIIFFSCTVAASPAGTSLLRELSRVWPGRTVIGFVSYGYVGGTIARTAAGNVTDTLRTSIVSSEPRGFPRLSEAAPTAKLARDGRIVRWPDPTKIWRAYVRADPNDAQRVRSDAQRRGIDPVLHYTRTRLDLDAAENPLVQRLL